MLTPDGERRAESQVRAVLEAMGPLDTRETVAITAALAQCLADLKHTLPVASAAVPPEELALFAAYNAATLAPPRGFLAGALDLTAKEAAALCDHLRDAAEHVASRQDRRSVLDGFKALDAALSRTGREEPAPRLQRRRDGDPAHGPRQHARERHPLG